MTDKKMLLLFEGYAGGRWEESGEQEVVPNKWGHPHDVVREHLERRAAQAAKEQELAVAELDNAFRVRVWVGEFTEIDTMCSPPERWPDAMVVYRKPDTTLLDAAMKVAATRWRLHTDTPTSDIPARGLSRTYYDGAFQAADAVYAAHRALNPTWQGPGTADLIGLAEALLPDHR